MTHDRQAIICCLGQSQACSCDILFEVLDGGSSWDRHNDFRSLEKPRQCDLQRSRVQLIRYFLDSLVCFFGLTEGSPGKNRNVVLLAVVAAHVRFTVGETVTILDRDDRHNFTSTFDMLASCI